MFDLTCRENPSIHMGRSLWFEDSRTLLETYHN